MIVVCLSGGLGNQLFQYAFARFLAKNHSTTLGINTWFYTRENPNRVRQLELIHFNIYCHAVFPEDFHSPENKAILSERFTYVADTGAAPEDILDLGDNLILSGEWAALNGYLFDDGFRDVIRRELVPKRPIVDPEFNALKDKIRRTPNSVAVHVRRGDYTKLTHLFALLDEDYYARAFELIESKVSEPEYFVFSDEIDWVERNFSFPRDVTCIKSNSVVQALELTRMCHHNINANSTFSWWGAYLNGNENKIVIMPEYYYTKEVWQTSYENEPGDRYMPASWLKV